MKKTSRSFIRVLNKKKCEFVDEFDIIASRMQPYEVSAFFVDLDSSYKEYSAKYFDEDKFKSTILKVYNVDLDDKEQKEEVISSIIEYSRSLISLKVLYEFIKVNDIDLGDTS